MKELVVISGKGGTGKTSITASFSVLGGKDIVVGDCDVDADDMHLLLGPDYAKSEDFYSGLYAEIDPQKCISCGRCAEICRFKAVIANEGKFRIADSECEGCGYCAEICPQNAVKMNNALVGKVFDSEIRTGTRMVHARLNPGADNSGKLVAKVKREAKRIADAEGKKMILIDGSPGTGCPVISSLTGADYVVLVTEPTVSGIHDLKRVFELVKKFRIPAGLIINKSDLNESGTEEIKSYADSENIGILGEFPYDEAFSDAITAGKTIVEYTEGSLKEMIINSWKKILENTE